MAVEGYITPTGDRLIVTKEGDGYYDPCIVTTSPSDVAGEFMLNFDPLIGLAESRKCKWFNWQQMMLEFTPSQQVIEAYNSLFHPDSAAPQNKED